MQTLSDMRRSGSHYRSLIEVSLFIAALIYESLSSIYQPLSPLLGLSFYYILTNYEKREGVFIYLLIALFSVYVEVDRGLNIGSFILFSLLFYNPIHKYIKKFINCQLCEIIVIISVFYIGYFSFNLSLDYLLNRSVLEWSFNYIIYIITDIFLVLVFL
jgi:hypothetical protein